jgi:hypothetical protein
MGNWNYTEASGSSHGTMRCTACGKQVESGRYRYRQKSKRGDWGYQVQHEACCLDDSAWAAMDAQQIAHEKRMAELSAACAAFKKTWGVSELDEYIFDEVGA